MGFREERKPVGGLRAEAQRELTWLQRVTAIGRWLRPRMYGGDLQVGRVREAVSADLWSATGCSSGALRTEAFRVSEKRVRDGFLQAAVKRSLAQRFPHRLPQRAQIRAPTTQEAPKGRIQECFCVLALATWMLPKCGDVKDGPLSGSEGRRW